MTKNIKNLTGAELKKQNKALDAQKEFTIEIGGEEYKLTHDIVFRKTKQIKLIEDLIEYFSAGAENPEILEMATPYTALLVIKHFTSLEVSNDIQDALALLAVLMDLEVLDKIIDKMPEEETKKLFDVLTETVGNMSKGFENEEKGE